MNQDKLKSLRAQALSLPALPGVYLMKNGQGEIIYIGKAKSLKNRVTSYFRSVDRHTPKVAKMVESVDSFDTIITGSEFEALILECSLIKQNQPKYNILLKDDKGYHYIKVHPGAWGRITAEKQRLDDGGIYIGPYTSSYVVNQTVDEANKAFLLPTCSRSFPAQIGKGRPCLNYHIKQCAAPCAGKLKQSEYAEMLDNAVKYIRGGGMELTVELERAMEAAAESLEFERAARLRDRINAIRRISERQNVVFTTAQNQDVIAIVRTEQESCASVLRLRSGRLEDKQDYLLGRIDAPEQARSDFMLQYYSERDDIPPLVSLDGACEDSALIERFLSERSGRTVKLSEPKRGERLRLVEMARENAAQRLAAMQKRAGRELTALDMLAQLLGLKAPPSYIEAYDISNIGSSTIVGGMVVFENARPLRSAYRMFKIEESGGVDDYRSMREMVSRRLARYSEHKSEESGFGRLPDLILIDGGEAHARAIAQLVREAGFTIPVFGMVKDNKHRTRAITGDGGEIAISENAGAFKLVSLIQEEVHRFTISYSRKRHSKTAFELTLTQVEGIGPSRAAALLKTLGGRRGVQNATLDELACVKGMTKPAAKALYEFLHPEPDA